MKKLIIPFILLCLLLVGCVHEMPLQQPVENIVKIELINEKEGGTLCTLTGADVTHFMNDLMELECRKGFEPQGEIGYLQIHIYYENGDADIFGRHGNAQITSGDYIMDGWYKFAEEDLVELFHAYTEQTP